MLPSLLNVQARSPALGARMKQSNEWKLVRNTWISAKPVLPSVWARKEGGHVVRARVRCPRTGSQKHIWKVLPAAKAEEALLWLRLETDSVKSGVVAASSPKVPFASYATSLFRRKIDRGEIRSAAGIEKWESVLKRLVESRLAPVFVDEIRRRDIEAWKEDVAKMITAGTYSPNTANTWLAVVKVVLRHAAVDYELPRSPAEGMKCFDTSEHRTYTREQPNSLTAVELGAFLALMFERHPQHFAMVYCGFATGLRPSSLRPLRRSGTEADVKWEDQVLCIRRSHTREQLVMRRTKTKRDLDIKVPKLIIDVLAWHSATQLTTDEQQASELLFPREDGGFRSASALKKPFADVARAMGLTKRITPKAMRRSFQDLARTAKVCDVVTRSISGHATAEMQRLYSTVTDEEQAEGLGRILGLVRVPPALPMGATAAREGAAEGAALPRT